jgi:hypothetical protein
MNLISASEQLLKEPIKWSEEDERKYANAEYPYDSCSGCVRDRSPVKKPTFGTSSRLPPVLNSIYNPGPGAHDEYKLSWGSRKSSFSIHESAG